MEKVSGAKVNATLLAGVYGQAKLRKTTMALMAPPEFRPIAYLDVDRGAALRLRLLAMTPEQRKALNVQETMPPEAGPWCAEGIDFFYPSPTSFFSDCFDFSTTIAGSYKMAIVDTVSVMATKILEEVKHTQYSGVEKATKRVTLQSGSRETVHATQSDYMVAQDRVMEVIKNLDAGKAHTLLLFHERTGEVKDAEGVKRIIAGPRTVGTALLESVPAILDVIVRLEAKARMEGGKIVNGVVMRTRNHNGIYIAGDRSGMFVDEQPFEPADFWKRITSLIQLAGTQAGGQK